MKNVHKIRKKREFLFDDKELYALGALTSIIFLLVFTLGFMVGQTWEEESVASPIAEGDYIPDDELEAPDDSLSSEETTASGQSEKTTIVAQKKDKDFQQSHFRVLPDSDTYVEVEVTPAGQVISEAAAENEPEQAARSSRKAAEKTPQQQDAEEQTPVPPSEQAAAAPTPPPQQTTQVAMAPSLPSVPKSADDEFRYGRQQPASHSATSNAPLSGTIYSVQVASSPSYEDSERLQQKFGQLGYLAFVMTADLGEKGIWYRVRVGNVRSSKDADLLKEELLEKAPKLTNQPFVIKVTED